MSTTKDTKQVTVRADPDLINDLDRALLEARADGHLPMNYNRSDALREAMRMIAEDPSILSEFEIDNGE